MGGDFYYMDYVKGLRCKECGERYDAGLDYVCWECFGPLEVEYDLDRLASEKGDRPFDESQRGLSRYKYLLPIDDASAIKIGDTPLIHAERLGEKLGIDELYLKVEGANPSLSFKDRVVASALSKAKESGAEVVTCASTGNLANSIAWHAAANDLECVIFVPEGKDLSGIAAAAACGAKIFEVAGNYDAANRLCTEAAERLGWLVINGNLKPYYLEGGKTIAFEIMEDLKDNPPAVIVSPVGGGGLLSMLWKGLGEMKALGMAGGELPALVAAQPEGCSPVVSAIRGNPEIRPVKPDTSIDSIAIGDPPDGPYVIKAVTESGGAGVAVSDDEAFEMLKLLAETEGIISGGAGGVAIGAAAKLAENGNLTRKGPVVVVLTDRGNASDIEKNQVMVQKTGAGLKDFIEIRNKN